MDREDVYPSHASWELHIVRREGYGASGLDHEVTFALDIRRVEVIHIRKLGDDEPENMLVRDTLRCEELRPTAEELALDCVLADDIFAEGGIERDGLDDLLHEVPVLLECDCASLLCDELFGDFSGHGEDIAVYLGSIADGYLMGVTRQWYHVVRREWIVFVGDDDVADLGEGDTVVLAGRVIATDILYRLEDNPTDTLPLLGVLDDCRDFVVVETFMDDTDECRGDRIFFEKSERALAGRAHVAIADFLEGFAVE